MTKTKQIVQYDGMFGCLHVQKCCSVVEQEENGGGNVEGVDSSWKIKRVVAPS